jgi:hypothetical protein
MAFKLFNKNKSDKSSKNVAETTTTTTADDDVQVSPVETTSTPEDVVKEDAIQPTDSNNPYEDDDADISQCSAKSEWDEGGASQCGYNQIVHDTLMSVGKTVHSILGDPPEVVQKEMKSVSGWFQEASYAVRDYTRGNANIEQDTHEVVSTIMSGGSTLGSPVDVEPIEAEYKPA